jgi:hypothetical protein
MNGAMMNRTVTDDHVTGQDVTTMGTGTAVVEDRLRAVGADDVLGAGGSIDHSNAGTEHHHRYIIDRADRVGPGTVLIFALDRHVGEEMIGLGLHGDDESDRCG